MVYGLGIYKDKNDTIIIIPYVPDEHGIRREYNKPITLNKPYQHRIISNAVKESFRVSIETKCQLSKQLVNVWQIATGIKSWNKFSKEMLLVDGSFYPEKDMCFLHGKGNLMVHIVLKV